MQLERRNGRSNGYDNSGYEQELSVSGSTEVTEVVRNGCNIAKTSIGVESKERNNEHRATWNNSIEFLMSCIAVSVGFGNIWRFPFTAYENGGGAFLIPYVILLYLVGKPFYFLEMIIGQFSGHSSVTVWRLSPGFAGVGWAQLFSTMALVTYYSSLMALTLYYLIASFSVELPWATCDSEWGSICVNSKKYGSDGETYALNRSVDNRSYYTPLLYDEGSNHQSSAELYFSRVVLHEKDSIDDGIGLPDWKLTLCLLGSWLAILLVMSQGVKSAGRASYFLAIFPYIVLVTLLVRAVTLDGAVDGILFFVTPNFSKLLDPNVWYAAVTQCFFSLSVCFGAIITYSGHNDFRHDIYRDAMIVTTLDTITSLIAGCTIFGILGNLAFEMGVDDIATVVKPGAGLAFISYPDAIAKFAFLPQLFAVLFFVMMFVLGVGSAVGMTSSITTVIQVQFPNRKPWHVVLPACCIGFLAGTCYVTPGGQFLLTLVDYYGTSFVVFILASFEITGVIWVYGLENFLDDIEFMLNRRAGVYWRLCWFIVTPLVLITIFVYTMATLSPLTYAGKSYPSSAHAAGWIILCIGVFQIPLWMLVSMIRNRSSSLSETARKAFQPTPDWGPRNAEHRKQWLLFKEEKMKLRNGRTQPPWLQLLRVLLCMKPK